MRSLGNGRVGLGRGQNLWCRSLDLCFQLLKFLVDDVFVVRKIALQPFEGASIILGLEVGLELVELLIAHLVCQAHTDTHLQRLIYMSQQTTLVFNRQTAEPDGLE